MNEVLKPDLQKLKRVVNTGFIKEIWNIYQEDTFVKNALVELEKVPGLFNEKLSKTKLIQMKTLILSIS